MQSGLVLRLVTIRAFEREDPLTISPAAQAKASVRPAIFTSQRRVSRRMTIDTARMHEDFVRFRKGCSGASGILSVG